MTSSAANLSTARRGATPSDTPSNISRRPGGYQIDYQRRPIRIHKNTMQLHDYIEGWCSHNQGEIAKIRRHGGSPDFSRFDELSEEMSRRWEAICVGNSRTAWVERSLTAFALMLDHRCPRFGRKTWKPGQHREDIEFELGLGVEEPSIDYCQPNECEIQQAVHARVFHFEWQRYLMQLQIRAPGVFPPGVNFAFPSYMNFPDQEVNKVTAHLAHCRPVGAFFETRGDDQWSNLGGREECRQRSICPFCHARHVCRLLERIEQGPWTPDRRQGKRIVMLRVCVPTGKLHLADDRLWDERDALGFAEWLRPSPRDYTPSEGDESIICAVDLSQSLTSTLTPYEVQTAAAIRSRLRDKARQLGMVGGLFFHTIGPCKRNFMHEISVIGEIPCAAAGIFEREFGSNASPCSEFGEVPVECLIAAEGYDDAIRLTLTGSSWRFDLREVRTWYNPVVQSRSFQRRSGRQSPTGAPRGLRGALAWQPLFLLSAASFWSRWKVLRQMRFRTYQPFGTWQGQIKSDKQHRTTVQRQRYRRRNGILENQRRRADPVESLRDKLNASGVSQAQLAREANVSRSAVCRLLKGKHGSSRLVANLLEVITRLIERSDSE